MSNRDPADLSFLHENTYDSGDYLRELQRRRDLCAKVASRLLLMVNEQGIEFEPRSVADPARPGSLQMGLNTLELSRTTTFVATADSLVAVLPESGFEVQHSQFGVWLNHKTSGEPAKVGELEVIKHDDMPAKLQTVTIFEGAQADARNPDYPLPYQHNVLVGMVADYLRLSQLGLIQS